jgi:hypothetical protein
VLPLHGYLSIKEKHFSQYYIDKIRTNYGKFSLRFQGPKAWNDIDDKYKTLSKSSFKNKIAENMILIY